MKGWIILCWIAFTSFQIQAQNYSYQNDIQRDGEVSRVWDTYLQENEEREEISCWRVLVLTTQDRRQLEDKIQTFKRKFPGMKYDWNYSAPFYRLKCGFYQTKLEASKAARQIKKHYASALEMRDKVDYQEFLDAFVNE